MALINTSVPNLIQGVSQQSDATRFDGQCEEQENALSSVAEGLKKRPNTRHVARLLEEAIANNTAIHFINRDKNEKYVIVHDGVNLRIFNILTGVEATITYDLTKDITVDVGWDLKDWNDSNIFYIASDYSLTTQNAGFFAGGTTGSPTELTASKKILSELQDDAVVSIKFSTTEVVGNWTIDIVDKNESAQTYTSLTTGSVSLADGLNQSYDVTLTLSGNASTAVNPHILLRSTSVNLSSVQWNMQTQLFEYTTTFTTDYLNSNNPKEDLKFKTIGDTTIALNTSVTVLEDSGLTPPQSTSQIVFFINARGSTNYNIGPVSRQTPKVSDNETVQTTSYLVNRFFVDPTSTYWGSTTQNGTGVNYFGNGAGSGGSAGVGGTAVTQFGSSQILIAEGVAPLTVSDGLSDSGMISIYKSVDSISDLPVYQQAGFSVRVNGDPELSQDDYYVVFRLSSEEPIGSGNGYWEETVKGDISVGLDKTTMPHGIVNTSPNVFKVSVIDYDQRKAGDEISNPHPSFVNSRINNIFLYKDRLGFLSNENVILSEAGQLFNFYRTTVTSLLDSAPIDVSIASGRVSNLKSAIGFQENLILFTENSQFVLKGGDLLTPKTVSITPVTNFELNDSVPPLALGSYLYFPFNRGNFTGVLEYTVNSTTDNYDSADITEHVPNYIPANISAMTGTTTEDIIALTTTGEPNSLFIYKYFWSENRKVLSSWSKFTFQGEIRGLEFIQSTLYMVVVLNNQTHLVSMPFESGVKDDVGFITHLDMRVSRTVNAGSDIINLPYDSTGDVDIQVWTKDGAFINSDSYQNTVQLDKPVASDTDVWVGIPYTMKYTFSEQLFKAQAGNGKSPSNAAKMMIRNGSVYYDKSSFFKVKVTPKFRDTYENVFTPDVVGSTTLGSLNLDSGFYRFPVFTKPEDTTITIENDSALPSTFQSAEFESFVHSRSNRYG